MGITLFSFGGILAPLRSLMEWLVHTREAPRDRSGGHRPAARSDALRPRSSWRTLPGDCGDKPPRRPLRVVRVVDASHTSAGAGRMFMSGRMADVCAELDRLAALEAPAG